MEEERPYPDAVLGQEEQPCFLCGKPTPWIDISFEINLCSKKCYDEMWRRYWVAVRIRGPIPIPGASSKNIFVRIWRYLRRR